MLNLLINKLAKALVRWCEKTDRVYHITGGVNKKTVYLVRYIVFKSNLGCIYIHRFMRSDVDDPHDHPWNFFTYVISGRYMEAFYDRKKHQISKKKDKFLAMWTKRINVRKPGSLAYRRATDIHQVIVDRPYEMSEIELAPFTICIIGPRIRQWGFWSLKLRGTLFTDWRQYLHISPSDPAFKGSE